MKDSIAGERKGTDTGGGNAPRRLSQQKEDTMESKETSKKRFYLKWPWNVLVYIILVVLLRIFAIPVILLLMWWNKKQQPDGPEAVSYTHLDVYKRQLHRTDYAHQFH